MFTLQAPHVRHTDSLSRSAGTDKRQRTLGRSEPLVLSDFKLGHRVLQVGNELPLLRNCCHCFLFVSLSKIISYWSSQSFSLSSVTKSILIHRKRSEAKRRSHGPDQQARSSEDLWFVCSWSAFRHSWCLCIGGYSLLCPSRPRTS
jgi:hypothetical protein